MLLVVGFVSLVGAGPGDPGLLTLAGRERLALADVVVYDRLVHPELLELAPAAADRIYIGEGYGGHALDQEEANRLLVALAGQGKRVVRLKGGDPFVFGRGGEEASELARCGVPFEVVPGVSSALAVPAYAGIPVTDRRFGSSVAIMTGHQDPADPACRVDWAGLATSADTLVILMGARRLAAITETLMRHGRSPSTPAAAITWGTLDRQRSVVAPLAELAGAAAGVEPPAVIVIGEVVALAGSLSWFKPELQEAVFEC